VLETDRANSREVSIKLPAEKPYYFDQHGRVILKSLSKLASSAPETDRANLGGASTIPPGKTLSYCYFDQDGKLIFRKKPELVSSAPETDRTNSGAVSTILPTATYIPNSVCTSQTDDGIAAPHASLPHIMVLPNSPKSSCMTPMPETSCDASQTDSQKFINWFCKSKVAKLDMQATHDGDAYPSTCNKTLSMAETLEINNPAILIRPEEADSTFGKNVIIGEPRECKKGKKDLDCEVVLEKSNDNRESLKITIKSSGLGGQAQTPMDKQKSATNTIVQRGSIRPTLKVGQTDFNVGGQKKSARLISQISQASCKQKWQHTYKDGVLIPYPLIHQNPHRWRMCAHVTHNEHRCFPHSRLSYDQSSSNKEGPIKSVLHKLANQVQRKGKTSTKQMYVLRIRKFSLIPQERPMNK
jgi:hypothetical protein